MNFVRRGAGSPLVLVHGIGGSHRSWDPVLPALAKERDVVAVDLPGFGATPPLGPHPTLHDVTDALITFLDAQGLRNAHIAGSSMGARLTLELARRGMGRNVVALDPGGFWNVPERAAFAASLSASIRLVRALRPMLPSLVANPVSRTALLAQFSAHPWSLAPDLVLRELESFATSPSFDPLLRDLIVGPGQQGATVTPGRVTIGWGRNDYVCFPSQAPRALAAFPHGALHWFERCGHFPQWDRPDETVRLILDATA